MPHCPSWNTSTLPTTVPSSSNVGAPSPVRSRTAVVSGSNPVGTKLPLPGPQPAAASATQQNKSTLEKVLIPVLVGESRVRSA